MAMTPRGDGDGGAATTPYHTGAGDVWPVFEEFKPTSEWQEDDESHILIIYLPGFMKEQIRVSTERRNIIRVRGERLISGNKWSRFLEDFQVPENSEMNSVRARFQGGILHITIQKKSVVHRPQETPLPLKHSSFDTPNQSDPQKGHAKVPPPVVANSKHSEPQKKSFIDAPKVVEKRNELKERTTEKEEKRRGKSKELPEDETPARKDKESKQKQRIQTSHAENGAFATKRYKKAVKGIAEHNEERQLLVNMGVAVLIIVAISAYATYKFTLGKDKN
ncbi:hypothetical protein CDL12_00628 [Handroanthus impetiginosus]|uniref:SHSP domain-containing protein n=1 Tax=Handroanthus impetiginosus TaxID=429701 RepID=A0A2G9IA15_9LAMI|nr:hypothetical protein CDL12_00628 [Handroanthus impetiginosus]